MRIAGATIGLFALTLVASCSSRLPWSRESPAEVNLAIRFVQNLPVVDVTVNGHPAKMIIGSATARTVLDTELSQRVGAQRPVTVTLGERRTVRVEATVADLPPLVDGIIGADAWAKSRISIDYGRALFTIMKGAEGLSDLAPVRFAGPPEIPITLRGKTTNAIVDTASPVALTMAGESGSAILEYRSGSYRVRIVNGDTSRPRLGSGFLARFVVIIDYRSRTVALFEQ